MTEHVDLDLLADHAAGLLDPDVAAEVDRLIHEDTEWARVDAALRSTGPTLAAQLRDLGERAEPMPADAAERLEATLAGLRADAALPGPSADAALSGLPADGALPQSAADGALSRPTTDVAHDTVDDGGRVVPITDAPSRRLGTRDDPAARRRSRRRSIAGWTSAAAAVAAIVVGGLALGGELTGRTGGATDGTAPPRPSAATGLSGAPAPAVFASGRDYTRQDVIQAAALGAQRHVDAGPVPQVPEQLRRLRDPAALDGCLHAVIHVHGGTVSTLDYARFEGGPALVVVLREPDQAGTRRVVVAGPDCGQPGAGTDERYAVTA